MAYLPDLQATALLKDPGLLDYLPIGVLVCDAMGFVVMANKKVGEYLGITLQAGMPADKYLFNPPNGGYPVFSIASLLAGGATIDKRIAINSTHYKISIVPVKDDSNIPAGAVISMTLLTDNLKKNTGKRSFNFGIIDLQVINNLQAAIYFTDTDGYIQQYNKAAAKLWQREPEIGKDRYDGFYTLHLPGGQAISPEDSPMARALRQCQPSDGEEVIVARPDGSRKHLVVYPQPVFLENGEMAGAVNLMIDITDAKISEEALRRNEQKLKLLNAKLEKKVAERTKDLLQKNEELKKSEERYHRMVSEVEDYAIVLLDKNGIIQNWNAGAEKIKGYKEEEIIGKSFHEFYLPYDRKNGLPVKLINMARKDGKAIHEGWRMRKDGTAFWGSIVITALHDADNNIVGFSKVTRDLTDKKIAEDNLREYARQLEFQNSELAQFAYAASHDMKEPLRKISFYNSYIADNCTDQLNEKSKDYLQRSINAVGRMSNLIEDLLAYSKTSAANESFIETNLNELVEDIIASHSDLVEESGATINTHELPVVKVIPFQFKQLLDNIINNAIKYKHPVRKLEVNISCDLVRGADIESPEADPRIQYYKISVADNGMGFQEQYAEKIFEIFQRLNNRSGYKGSGIGLAICKRIVQNHRGIINALGRENEGAVFNIYIPK